MIPRTSWTALQLALFVGVGTAVACQRGPEGSDSVQPETTELGAQGPAKAGPVPRDLVAQHEPPAPREVRRVEAQGQLGPGRGTLLIDLHPPADGKLTEGAPLRVSARGRDLSFPESIKTPLDPDELPVRLPIVVSDGAADPAEVDLTYYWCSHGDSGSCHPVRVRLLVELDLSGAGAGGEAHLVHRPDS